jgi:hypothetical protein
MFIEVKDQNVKFVLDIVKRISKTETITKYTTSYGLKSLVEKLLTVETKGVVSYVSDEELFQAMNVAGFKSRKTYEHSPNYHYNLSRTSIDKVFQQIL